MNRHARELILQFNSGKNEDHLRGQLSAYFKNPDVDQYLKTNLHDNMRHFAYSIEQELLVSDPLPGTTISDQIFCYNNQFLTSIVDFIRSNVIGEEEPEYNVTDGGPGKSYGGASADDLLAKWWCDSGKLTQLRDDPPGLASRSACAPKEQFSPGITFCDQSGQNVNQHVSRYENTTYKRAFNDARLPHERTPIGVATAAADARMLSRSIFRKNERGIENGIPLYEQRLYRRNYERDINETLPNQERDCIISGYDMSGIKKRIDHVNKVKSQYSPCGIGPKFRLNI